MVISDSLTGVLLVGPLKRVSVWQNALNDEDRYLLTIVYAEKGLLGKLPDKGYDVALLDASSFKSPRHLLGAIPDIKAAAIYVFLPGDIPQDKLAQIRAKLEQIPAVKNTFVEAPNLRALLGPPRQRAAVPIPGGNGQSHPQNETPTSSNPLIIAVWNQAGGVGKTTIASNLAYVSAERGFRTLLVGLGTPDYVPLIINGLKKRPNLTGWHSNPTTEGLRAVIQRSSSNLHVIAGFPDMFSESDYQDIADTHPASIPNLANMALKDGYKVIIFDAPPSQLAASAIAAANHLVLVARASQEGVYRTAVAYQTVTEQLEGVYRFDPANIRVALNGLQRGHGLSADIWHDRVAAMTSSFPPVTASIPDFSQVLDIQDKRAFPVQQDSDYRAAITPLANSLFGYQRSKNGQTYAKEKSFLGITFRW